MDCDRKKEDDKPKLADKDKRCLAHMEPSDFHVFATWDRKSLKERYSGLSKSTLHVFAASAAAVLKLSLAGRLGKFYGYIDSGEDVTKFDLLVNGVQVGENRLKTAKCWAIILRQVPGESVRGLVMRCSCPIQAKARRVGGVKGQPHLEGWFVAEFKRSRICPYSGEELRLNGHDPTGTDTVALDRFIPGISYSVTQNLVLCGNMINSRKGRSCPRRLIDEYIVTGMTERLEYSIRHWAWGWGCNDQGAEFCIKKIIELAELIISGGLPEYYEQQWKGEGKGEGKGKAKGATRNLKPLLPLLGGPAEMTADEVKYFRSLRLVAKVGGCRRTYELTRTGFDALRGSDLAVGVNWDDVRYDPVQNIHFAPILQALGDGPIKASRLQKLLGVGETAAFRNALASLVEDGRICKEDGRYGRYYLADSPPHQQHQQQQLQLETV